MHRQTTGAIPRPKPPFIHTAKLKAGEVAIERPSPLLSRQELQRLVAAMVD